MRWRILALLAAALVLLEGCDGRSGAQPAPTPTTATSPASVRPSTAATRAPTAAPSVPPDVPRTGPNLVRRGEQPPVMPVLATEHTTAGAIAFAKFFIQTIDWGFATTSGAYMRHYFQPSCTGCESLSSGLNQAQQAGHRYVGGRLTVRTASLAYSGRFA